jgi:hypothetical protein
MSFKLRIKQIAVIQEVDSTGNAPQLNPRSAEFDSRPRPTGPFTVAARSEARTVFARSNTGVLGWNPIRFIDVCYLFHVCVVLCVVSDLETG